MAELVYSSPGHYAKSMIKRPLTSIFFLFTFQLLISFSSISIISSKKRFQDNDDEYDTSKKEMYSGGKGLTFQDKQTKLNACSILSRDRISKDMEYVQLVSTFVNPNSDSNESIGQVMSLMLMSCYKNISPEKSKHVVDTNQQKPVNSMNYEYKELLELEKWEDIYISNDEKKIKEEMFKYQNIMTELRQIQQSLMKDKKPDNENNEETEQNEDLGDTQDEDYTSSRRRPEQDLNIFGVEINKLPANTKLILGVSLIFILFGILAVLASKALKNLPQEKQKTTKKKKKDN